MRDFGNATLRYCPQLKQNVSMEERHGQGKGKFLECLNKCDCGYERLGCRNLLIERSEKVEEKSS